MAKKKLTLEDVIVPKEEIPYEVPENWCWVYTPSIFDIQYGKNLPTSKLKDEGYVVYGANGPIGFYSQYTYEEPKVLISCRGANSGAINVSQTKSFITNNSLIMNSKIDMNIKFIEYLFMAMDKKSLISGTAQPQITVKAFDRYPIPLPPLDEQERIVKMIESLFEKVDKASELVEEARDEFEKRRAAILEKAFSGELTKKWREENGVRYEPSKKRLKDIFKFIGGGTPSKSNRDYWDGDIYWASVKDIKNDYLYETQDRITELGLQSSSTNITDIDDIILVTRIAPGKITIAKEKIAINQDLKIIKPKLKINNKFIYYLFLTKEKEIVGLSQGTTVKGITIDKLNNMVIDLPSLDEQEEIARILDRILNKYSRCNELTYISNYIENIKKSILAKAFRGELGSNDINEESSIKLLEQIINV